MKQILVLCNHFEDGYGGVPAAILELSKLLVQMKFSTDVISNKGFYKQVENLEMLNNGQYALTQPLALNQYDGILVAGAWVQKSLRRVIVAWMNKIPIIYAPKGMLCMIEFRGRRGLLKAGYFTVLEIWKILFANAVLFTSNLERKNTVIPDFIVNSKSFIAPEAVNLISSSASIGRYRKSSEFLVGFVSQFSPRKGLLESVQGFIKWSEANPTIDAKFVIAGTPIDSATEYFELIKDTIANAGVSDKVIFIGQINDVEKSGFYRALNVLINPSKFESFGLVPIEALVNNCPVIISRHIGAFESIQLSSDAITYINEVTAQDICDAIELVRCKKMNSDCVSNVIRSEFSFLEDSEVILKIYKKIWI
jgi:glycosyltransferase involved in cell wall biosynthesis